MKRRPVKRQKRRTLAIEPHHPERIAQILFDRKAFSCFEAVSPDVIRAKTGAGQNEMLDADQFSPDGACIVPDVDRWGLFRGLFITSDPGVLDRVADSFMTVAREYVCRAMRMRKRATALIATGDCGLVAACAKGEVAAAIPLNNQPSTFTHYDVLNGFASAESMRAATVAARHDSAGWGAK